MADDGRWQIVNEGEADEGNVRQIGTDSQFNRS